MTCMKTIIYLLLITFLPARVFAENADAEELIEKGNDRFEEFDNKGALAYYEKAYAQNPDDVELLTRLTWTYNNVGEDLNSEKSEQYFEKAVAHAEKLRMLAPKHAKTYFLLSMTKGNLALFRGGKEKVRLSRTLEKEAKKAIKLDPDYSPPYAVLGVYYREVAQLNWVLKMFAKHLMGGLPDGTLAQSEKMFLKAIEKDSGNVYAHIQLAQTYEAMEEEKKALKYYKKVLNLPIGDHQDPLHRKTAKNRIKELK